MHPARIVVGRQDQLFDAHQAGGILPAARLPVQVETGDVPAHQAALAEFGRLAVDPVAVAGRRRQIFRQQVDVTLFLNGPLRDPFGVYIVLDFHAKLATRGLDAVAITRE